MTVQKPLMIQIAAVDESLWRVIVANEAKLRVLVEAGVFDLDFGKVVINVQERNLQSVHVERRTYQRKT